MPPLTNIRHEKFAKLLFQGVPPAKAYAEVGFTPNRGNASRLKSDENIQARIIELQAEAARVATLDKSYVLSGLMRIHEKSSQESPVLDKDGNSTGEYRYDSSGAVRALELLGKHLRMFGDGAEAQAAVNTILQAVLSLLQAAPPEFRDYAVSELRKYQAGPGQQIH